MFVDAKLHLLDVVAEDFVNYKESAMTLVFPKCSFKCNTDAGKVVCQNYELKDKEVIEYSVDKLIEDYKNNPITKAIVCQGLEPLDSHIELKEFLSNLRESGCFDPLIIYTGYTEEEAEPYTVLFKEFPNVIVKFGRYIPGRKDCHDEILGVRLASDNQYAKKIS